MRTHFTQPKNLAFLATAILALHPILWLVNTWQDPSYDSHGFWIFLTAAGLFFWSFRSPLTENRAGQKSIHENTAIALLILTSFIRLAGQMLAINILGAMALIIDVYALGILCRLPERQNAISPGWLAFVFAISLPFANLLQRTAGYVLQLVSAHGARNVMGLFADVEGSGIRMLLNGREILVDLPCAGTGCILWLLLFYGILMTLRRPPLFSGFLGLFGVVFCAYLVNTLRITLLAVGIAWPAAIGHLDLLAQPWHDLLGIAILVVGGFLPLCAVASRMPSGGAFSPMRYVPRFAMPEHWQPGVSLLFLTGALLIVNLPQKPLDVAEMPRKPLVLPAAIDQAVGRPIPLSDRETAYFTQFGGQAAKMQYGENTLLVIETSAPLRHLHNPADCLRGMGLHVRYASLEDGILPAAIYYAREPGGREWRVAASFVSDRGEFAMSVPEAIWRWTQQPDTRWRIIQRITPVHCEYEADARQWDHAIAAALDLKHQSDLLQPDLLQAETPTRKELPK